MPNRRQFLRHLALVATSLYIKKRPNAFAYPMKESTVNPTATLFRSLNGTPSNNMAKVIDLMGGVSSLFGPNDVVVIKPNVQWWNQGAPNLAALRMFVDLIMKRPGGFGGEVVIAENNHRGSRPGESAGWSHAFDRNSDTTGIKHMGDLVRHLKDKYGDQFSVCHWVDVDAGARRVYGPGEGNGYVYCDGTGEAPLLEISNGAEGNRLRKTIMTYPVFTTDQGTIVDYKNGVWKDGEYTDQPVRVVNFAALNHHSIYCGATSAIKNYLGVSDLSGGPDPNNNGLLTNDYYNFHSFPFDKWAEGPTPGMLGAEVGYFLKSIRNADLHITTAEWVGLASRTDAPVSRTRAVLASTDPVALDYHATKYILYPNSKLAIHNPDNQEGPLHQDLKACAEQYGGVFDESEVKVLSHDFSKNRLQRDDELVVKGDTTWGTDPKAILKYLVLRYGSFLL